MPGQQEAAPAFSDTGPAGKGPAHIPALRSSSLLPHFKVCEFTLPFANSFGGIIFFSSLEACRHSILSSNCMKQALLEEETFSQGGLSLNHCNSSPDTSLYPSVPAKHQSAFCTSPQKWAGTCSVTWSPGMPLFSLFQQFSFPCLQHQFNKGSKVLHLHSNSLSRSRSRMGAQCT